MLPDPGAVTAFDWLQIGKWLTRIWIYFFLVVGFSATFLTAHAIIPSMVASGHVPSDWGGKLRRPMYATAAIMLVGMGIFLAFTVEQSHIIERFWDRWFI